ncbi:hypothetical protein COCC4DRAFT_75979 [Bipolaris maydis ATCC 48331]|uniref:Heterokaryon incompatibility domain-containing protein n=2 Tax=Cochliobolus heterostrophus TaxID=5016 RepID=M2UBL2_COCH5|nr:uncharacterized protein COCC4DRAFT_75979 [Bipolaris maydis ATCC 48331]EMD85373.1 hypothetical protein COCHEDRAFT_1188389 [Bipolaris maydis C5]ENI00207.1 hypothetical protein COCC4DRAFT_75979 [Bipolaris maydis ATCC 48331]KAJ6268176.1 heterokaryon incompatibility protein-domain-containing protein [Bipolaris maydis]
MANTSLYQPLDPTREEFRLLRIHPTNIPQSIISCQLFTVSLVEEPSYKALSYEWGQRDITKPIIVNGIRVQVTHNLEAALQRIRQSESEVILWVDAVCINQQDLDERSTQVAMMSRLYSKTTLTYAWLGEDDDGSAERTFSLIRGFVGDFTERVEDIDQFTIKFGKGQCDQMFFCLQDYVAQNLRDGKSALVMSDILDMNLVFSRSYWYRTWVHQELVLPPKVSMLSGSVSISFNMMMVFGDIINWIGVHAHGGWKARIFPTTSPQLLRTSGCVVDTVQSVVQFSTPQQTTDALLDFIVSNITMSHPTGTTFLQALCCSILGYCSVDGFQYQISMYDIRTFLHWILDCRKEKPLLHGRFQAFVEQNNLMALFESVPDEISMSLRFAAVTGAIDHLLEPYKDAKDHSAFLAMTPQQRMAPFWGSESYPDTFQADIEWKIPSKCVNLEPMRRRIRGWAYSKSLIVTEKGYIGFATRGVLVADDICIVAGCPYPTIVRPSGGRHQVVGGGFIFGLMDGELFRDGYLTDDSQQTFEFV